MRIFADWNEPLPGSMEMDLVAHRRVTFLMRQSVTKLGEATRGSMPLEFSPKVPK
ncbi:hypothetical protein [Mesorhizobium intechi]|uniref:hypothetical protein n=1 Tax=Mesorhizobium intechi TaxID=537601 RepID=UPI00142EAB6F|nr:hypothetical protein [Mesorhizobium intechi]